MSAWNASVTTTAWLGIAAGVAARRRAAERVRATTLRASRALPGGETAAHLDAARAFNRSSALLALVGARGQRASSIIAARSRTRRCIRRSSARSCRSRRDCMAAPTAPRRTHRGAATRFISRLRRPASPGTGFHLYNITKRPGGVSWHNLFYAAPIGAPMALLLSGALGAVAERLRDEPAVEPQLFGMPAGRALGLVAAVGLAGTVGEVALLHFRGAYQNPAMYAPVTAPGRSRARCSRTPRSRRHASAGSRVLAQDHRRAGLHRRGLSCARRRAQSGRLAQLESEHPQWSAAAGAAEFHGIGARGPRRAAAQGDGKMTLPPATAIPATTC